MMRESKVIFLFFCSILVTLYSFAQGSDQMTITTYYPSPHGVYSVLRLSPGGRPASTNTGDIYYDDGSGVNPAGFYYYDGTDWQAFGGGGGNWTLQDSDLYATDTNWNVGIGTTSPGAKLEVAGQVKITGGSPGANKVLTSDANGLARWETPGGGQCVTLVSGCDTWSALGTPGGVCDPPTPACPASYPNQIYTSTTGGIGTRFGGTTIYVKATTCCQ